MKDPKVTERLALLGKLQASEGIIALSRRDWSEADFAETMLVLWGELEYCIDILVTMQYRVEYDDVKAGFLVHPQVEDKISFLRQIGIISPDLYCTITKFKKKRNELFHSRRGKEMLYFTLTKSEKEDRILEAWSAYVPVLGLVIPHPKED
jgi:hypothetical protein